MQITKASQLTGVFPALFTPLMNDDPKNLRNSIDYKKMEKMIDDLIAAGVSGILPVGTTAKAQRSRTSSTSTSSSSRSTT